MLLFSRVVTLTGKPRETISWAVGITEYVNANSELDVSLWSADFGYPLGTVAWSAVVESQVALAEGTAKLLVDDGYFDQLDNGRDFATQPGQDFLRELVHGEPSDPPPLGAVASITTATALVDRMADAVGWAIESPNTSPLRLTHRSRCSPTCSGRWVKSPGSGSNRTWPPPTPSA